MKNTPPKMNSLTRREFVRGISSVGLGLALTPTLLSFPLGRAEAVENAGKVVVASSPNLTQGVSVNAEVAEQLLNAAIKALTNQDTVEDAWRSVFPSLAPNDVIGIKINALFQLSTHRQVVDAIVQNLVAIGVPENNIIIWDKSDGDLISSGYPINRGNTGVRCFGTNGDYDNTVYKIGGQSKRLSRILTQTCTYLINVPVLKDHSIAGVTLSMKNHYGSVNSPNTLHDNRCDPYIAELNNTAPIREKTRLIVLDASVGIYNGGPGGTPQFQANSLIVGQDPVALDAYGLKLIDEERVRRGLPPVADVGRPARYIQTAADLGLGTMNPDEMQIIHVEAQEVEAQGKRPITWGQLKAGGKDR